MKVLILNFSAFSGKKDPSKSYVKFDVYDLESRTVIPIFSEAKYCATPGGEVPKKEFFPAVADVDFRIGSYVPKGTSIPQTQIRVNEIFSWKHLEVK